MSEVRSVDLLVDTLRSWCDAVREGRYADASTLGHQLSVEGSAVLTGLRPEVARQLGQLVHGRPGGTPEEGSAESTARRLAAFLEAVAQTAQERHAPPAEAGPTGPRTLHTHGFVGTVTLLAALVRAVETHGSVMLLPCRVLITSKNLADAVHLVVVGARVEGGSAASTGHGSIPSP